MKLSLLAASTLWGLLRRAKIDPPGGSRDTSSTTDEAEFEATSRRLRNLIDRLDVIVWEADPHSFNFSFVNRAAERVLGYPVVQWLRSPTFWQSRLHPDDRERVLSYCREEMRRGRDHELEYRVVAADGRVVWLRDLIQVIKNSEGHPIGMVGVMLDITDQRNAETKLQLSEERFRSIFHNAAYAMCFIGVDGAILDANQAMAQMLGYDSPRQLLDLNAFEDVYRDADEHRQLLTQISDGRSTPYADVEWKRADGRPLSVRVTVRPERNASGDVVAFEMISENVTDRRALEHQLHEAQKLEAIGRLAGGIAHDFNNLLTVISGYAALLQERLGGDDGSLRYADGIVRASERAAALTQQLLAFGRRQVLQPKVVQMNGVIADLDRMLRRLIGEDIELVTLLDPAASPVRVDPAQLEQVVMNLVLNARDAMEGGGSVTLETRNVTLNAADVEDRVGLSPGMYVQLSVSDTGRGMDNETLRHIFEPFYSTKQPDKGSGLGLATVYGIVRQSGGHIAVTSEPGAGSRFTIFLPQCLDPIAAAPPAEPAREAPRGTETVLVVEDEEAVRSLTCQVLRSKGYAVLEARHGADALDVVTNHPQPIQLLLTDLVMPQIGGKELAQRLMADRTDLRVLYVSGYSDQILFGAEDLGSAATFLQKPFSPDRLARKVREILDRPIA
ncbi:MAG: PAS domain S-box protein [Acidobacteriota bacterium]